MLVATVPMTSAMKGLNKRCRGLSDDSVRLEVISRHRGNPSQQTQSRARGAYDISRNSKKKEMTKTVLITGANRGIGLEFARLYKQQKQWNVIATARDPTKAEELQKVADQVIQLDVSSTSDIERVAQQLQDVPIDLLINNAGMYTRKSFDQLTADDMTLEYRVNALAPFFMSRALLPSLRRASNPRIINMTSRMGSIADNGSGGSYAYRASKSALNALTKSFSIDVKDVPVVLVHPGFIQTDMTMGRGDMGPSECAQKMVANLFDEFVEKPQGECRLKTGGFYHRDGQELPW
eukprot:Partr_v1_DN26829_c0_g1_i3_m40552 putative Short chain dehydrogenase